MKKKLKTSSATRKGPSTTRKLVIDLTSSNGKKEVAGSELVKHGALKVAEDEHVKMVAPKLARTIANKIA